MRGWIGLAGASVTWLLGAGASHAQDATCVVMNAANAGGQTRLSGTNACGSAVQYSVCATVPGQSRTFTFAKTLKPDEAWSFAFANASGQDADIQTNYCRAGAAACPAVCGAVHLSGVIWEKTITADMIASYYPEKAANDEVSGSATVSCVVKADLHVGDCKTISETPAGYGFATSLTRAAMRFYRARPLMADGKSAVGASAQISLKFGAK